MNIGQLIAERGKPFYSFEFFPPKDPDQWPDFFKMAERLAPLEPLFTSVTYGAGGSSQDSTLEIVSHLKKEFLFETMAHLTCVGATQEHITNACATTAWIMFWPCAATSPKGRTSTGKPPNSAMPRISSVSPRRIIPTWASASPDIRPPILNRRASPATGATPSPKSVKVRTS